MQKLNLPPDVLEASLDFSDPVRRYAAVSFLWKLRPNDVTCQDLLTPGGKNSLPIPTDEEAPEVNLWWIFWQGQMDDTTTTEKN